MDNALGAAQQRTDIPTLVLSLGFATMWSLIIFNLDRFVVSSAGHGDGTENIPWQEIKGALPRIAMAIVI